MASLKSATIAAMMAAAQAAQVAYFNSGVSTFSAEALENIVHSQIGAAENWKAHYDYQLVESNEINGDQYRKFIQVVGGVPVVDSEVTVHTSDNTLRSVVGNAVSSVIAPEPTLTVEDARVAFKVAFPEMKVITEPALMIKADALVYESICEFIENEEMKVGRLAVDAHTGKVHNFETILYNAINREIYLYPNQCTFFWNTNIPGSLLIKEGGSTSNTKANYAYKNLGVTYNFYKTMFNRDSYDNLGSKLLGTIELQYTDKVFGGKCGGDNAAWIGDPYNQMIFFQDGQVFKDIENDITVIAHEVSHAVTDKTSGLVYKDESGAINEAFSDVIAAAAHAWLDNGGTATSKPKTWTTTEKTYWIGEDSVTPTYPQPALRYMNNPTLDGRSPDNYAEIKRGTEDNGYVHSNSGIFNLFFYLLAEGGKHPRIASNSVVGIGIEKAVNIVYNANVKLFTKSTTYEQSRYHLANAAASLYGAGSQEVKSVHAAMDAVKVPGSAAEMFEAPAVAKIRGVPVTISGDF